MRNTTTPMRILYLIPYLTFGGAEIMLVSIIRELKKRGHQVKLLYLFPHPEAYQNFPDRIYVEQEIKPVQTSSRVVFSTKSKVKYQLEDYRRILDEFKPEVIHSHLFLAEILAHSVVIPGVKYFSHGHDNMPQFRKFGFSTLLSKVAFTNYIEFRWLVEQYRLCRNEFFAISPDVQRFFKNTLPKDLHHGVHLFPNGIDFHKYHSGGYRKRDRSEVLKLISVGSLVKKKNHTFLIDVVNNLKRRGVKLECVVCGNGILRDELESKVQDLNLENEIFFVGNVEDVPSKLKEADLYVHPASYEPFGLVLLEAMAAGLPVISLDGRGNRELLINGENGYLIPEQDVEEFSNKILEVWNAGADYQRMSDFALAFAGKYDMGQYAERLVAVYRKAEGAPVMS